MDSIGTKIIIEKIIDGKSPESFRDFTLSPIIGLLGLFAFFIN